MGGPSIMSDRKRFYFTFPDKVFSYECRGCGACCKGLGIGLDGSGGQVDGLIERYPQIIPFLRKRGLAWTAFNPRGGCWFLDQQGLCAIERDHGRDAKPASCRLFPFNRVFRLGEHTIVDYNSVICPLRAVPADAPAADIGSSGRVSHGDIRAEIESIADPAVIGTALPGVKAEEGQRFVTRERAIAAACFAQAAAAEPELDPVWRAQAKEGAPTAARNRVGRSVQAIIGQPFRQPSPRGLIAAFWLTPSMRFNELFGPRDYDPRPEREKLLPDMWLAWLGFLGAAEKLTQTPLDLRQATSVWSEMAPLAYLVARFGHAPTMEPGPVELPGAADPGRVVQKLAEACIGNRKARKPLSRIVEPLLEPYRPHERVALARMMEPLFRSIRWRRPRT